MRKAACILLIRPDGRILGASRRNSLIDFNLVGGKVDSGESVREAAVREFAEETGTYLSTNNLIEVFTHPCYGEADYETTTFLVYQQLDLAAQQIPENPNCPEDGILIKWITWNDLLGPNSSFREYNQLLYNKISHLLEDKP